MGGQTKLLIVDDEPFSREILGVLLENAGYAVEAAASGKEALERLFATPEDWDTILLDRTMPGMDGMEVLARLKDHEILRHVPVIMQTAVDGEREIVEGIRKGVFYYLIKPINRELLLSITQAAVQDYSLYRRLVENLRKRASALSVMMSGTFVIRTPQEANNLAIALASTCPNASSAVIGFSELMVNAIEHGNLGIQYEEKSKLIADQTWNGEIDRRLHLPENAHKSVTVIVERSADTLTVQITDMGTGFDWLRYMDMDLSRVFKTHGRGIALASKAGFSNIEYRGRGNEVICTLPLTGEPEGSPQRDKAQKKKLGQKQLRVLFVASDEAPLPPAPRKMLTRSATLKKALEQLGEGSFDVILLCLCLKGMSISHAVRRLGEAAPNLPIIIWAEAAQETEAIQAVLAGALDYMIAEETTHIALAQTLDLSRARNAARRRLSQRRQMLNAGRQKLFDWFWEMDETNRFSWFSSAFEPLAAISSAEILGKHLWDIDTLDRQEERWGRYKNDLEAHKPFNLVTCRYRDAQGQRRAMKVSGEPAFNAAGGFMGYVGTGLDVTEEVETATRLSDAYALLKDMFDDVQTYRERLEEDLESARDAQKELLPDPEFLREIEERLHVSITSHFEPSSELGGDIWGIAPLSGSRFAIYIVDFSGHGVAAALNTFRLHALMQEGSGSMDDPASYLRYLNRRLSSLLPLGQYATMLYGVFDPALEMFTYAAAGAPRPMVLDLSSGAIAAGNGAGLPLGASPEARYENRTLTFPKNALLLLWSDALSDSPDAEGNRMGGDGVTRLLRQAVINGGPPTAASLLAPFLANVSRPLPDDLTAVCCWRRAI
jgi:PAS domain S-box-containing protein